MVHSTAGGCGIIIFMEKFSVCLGGTVFWGHYIWPINVWGSLTTSVFSSLMSLNVPVCYLLPSNLLLIWQSRQHWETWKCFGIAWLMWGKGGWGLRFLNANIFARFLLSCEYDQMAQIQIQFITVSEFSMRLRLLAIVPIGNRNASTRTTTMQGSHS